MFEALRAQQRECGRRVHRTRPGTVRDSRRGPGRTRRRHRQHRGGRRRRRHARVHQESWPDTFAPRVRQGAVTRDGRGEVVTGVVMMLMGENSRVVAQRVREKIEEIKPSLPKGVTVDSYYDRTALVRKTIGTVEKNLVEGGILVIAVSARPPGQHPRRPDRGVGDPVVDAVCVHRHGVRRVVRQSDESRRDRLRPDRRRVGRDDRKHRPPPRRGAAVPACRAKT